jgi:predicted nucleotidyltransferase
MKGRARIPIPKEQIAAFCRRHHIRKLSLFGSVLRDDFRCESDVDVLVEFDLDKTPGLAFFAMQDELTTLLGRSVDLNTSKSLSRYFRDSAARCFVAPGVAFPHPKLVWKTVNERPEA